MRRLRRRGSAFGLAAAAAIAVVAAACSAPGSGGGQPAKKAGAAPAGNITYQLYQQPDSFNPFAAINGADGEIASLEYRPLLAQESGKDVGLLATSWQVNKAATTYTFHLAHVNWSNGQPFTAADVVFTYEAYANPATKSNFAGNLGEVQGAAAFEAGQASSISGITTPDSHTVVLTLTAPDASFIGNVATLDIVPKKVFGSVSPASFAGSPLFHAPTVGIGPYIFSKWISATEIEFVPNKQSQEAHPLAHLYAAYLTSDTALTELQTGEVDIAEVAPTDVASLSGASNVKVVVGSSTAPLILIPNLANPILSDYRVRQAIMYAIDRQSILKNVVGGDGSVPQSPLAYPSWAVPSTLTQYSYNPTKAKQLLAAAGWKASTELDLQIVPGQTDRDNTMNIIQGELKAVGINAKVQQLQPAQLSALLSTNRKNFDLIISILSQDPTDPGLLVEQRFTSGQSLNIEDFSNAQVNQLSKEGLATTDQSKRQQIYQQINTIINQQLPFLPLFTESQPWGVTTRVQGFNPNLVPATSALEMAQDWKVTS